MLKINGIMPLSIVNNPRYTQSDFIPNTTLIVYSQGRHLMIHDFEIKTTEKLATLGDNILHIAVNPVKSMIAVSVRNSKSVMIDFIKNKDDELDLAEEKTFEDEGIFEDVKFAEEKTFEDKLDLADKLCLSEKKIITKKFITSGNITISNFKQSSIAAFSPCGEYFTACDYSLFVLYRSSSMTMISKNTQSHNYVQLKILKFVGDKIIAIPKYNDTILIYNFKLFPISIINSPYEMENTAISDSGDVIVIGDNYLFSRFKFTEDSYEISNKRIERIHQDNILSSEHKSKSGTTIVSFQDIIGVYSLEISKKKDYLLIGTSNGIYKYTPSTNCATLITPELQPYNNTSEVISTKIKISPDGKYLLISGGGDLIRIYLTEEERFRQESLEFVRGLVSADSNIGKSFGSNVLYDQNLTKLIMDYIRAE